MKLLYQIEYKNKLTGKKEVYMNVGFSTQERAEREIEILKKEQEKRNYTIEELLEMDNQYIRSWMIAEDYRVKPVKCRGL